MDEPTITLRELVDKLTAVRQEAEKIRSRSEEASLMTKGYLRAFRDMEDIFTKRYIKALESRRRG